MAQASRLGMALTVRRRFTIAQVNAGATIAAAVPGMKHRLVDAHMISVGGAAAAVTTVDILATLSAASRKLVTFAQADLAENTVRTLVANGTVLAAGASFTQNDANTAITIGKTGSDVTTATHIDLILVYATEEFATDAA